MIRVTVTFFGPSRDLAGVESVNVELPERATVVQLAAELCERFPRLSAGMASVRFAVCEAFVSEDHVLADGDAVAVIPPVSGGAPDDDWIELIDRPLEIDRVYKHIGSAAPDMCGGVCIFEGRTRIERTEDGDTLVALEYEAYRDMAIRQMHSLAEQARKRWPIGALVLVHRAGAVAVGEPSVIIAVTSAHRAEAFDACRWLIDELKREVPIWKKEVWSSGRETWAEASQTEPRP